MEWHLEIRCASCVINGFLVGEFMQSLLDMNASLVAFVYPTDFPKRRANEVSKRASAPAAIVQR